MKLHFEDDLDYQKAAIESVVGLFKGQEISHSEFSVMFQPKNNPNMSLPLGMEENELGIGNRLLLTDKEIKENLCRIQLDNCLCPSEKLASGDFTVEMETGTGKTYVYLRTLFELHKNYGFTKFVIVVPSIAIKEGTYKTLQITRKHFENLYPKAKGYEYFLYDSKNVDQVRVFATSSNIQIMISTIHALARTGAVAFKQHEATGGEKPFDLIKATNPIIIVDEPQSVDGGLKGKGKKALEEMKPLCTLRYSATHIDKHHMVYRLDAVDAYERGLVKQIEVAALQIDNGNNKPYIRLESTRNRRNAISAQVEIDVQRGKNIKRVFLTVEDGDYLEQVTKRSIYENMQIGAITCGKGNESIEVKVCHSEGGFDKTLKVGEAIGGVDPDQINRLMISRTIKEHLDKELTFITNGQPIKVLSLFFIDSVKYYRQYDEEGHPSFGKYALMFEEEYRKLAKSNDYRKLFEGIDLDAHVSEVHNGYFSIDKKVVSPFETQIFKKSPTKQAVETSAYNLIMKDKEKLLSFDTKLKFIFSHSALKEGWDNPNVFQICTLRDMGSERERRQTIGRGLRLAVMPTIYGGVENLHRTKGHAINTLTVIANESYEQFADNLQKEIEQDTGIRFGIIEQHHFSAIKIISKTSESQAFGFERSKMIWQLLKDKNYVDATGKVQDTLRAALQDDSFELPDKIKKKLKKEYGKAQTEIITADIQRLLRKFSGKLKIKNARDRKVIRTREAVLESDEFKALWDRIKYKTTYRVEFDNLKLISNCASTIGEACSHITTTRAQFRKADIAIGKDGVTADETSISGSTRIHDNDIELPDIITDLQDKTQLTRKSIVQILIESKVLENFKRNPQQFLDCCVEAINRTKRLALVHGIRYTRMGEEHYYAQELFAQEELKGYIENTLEAQKSVYTHVVYDSSGPEKTFAEDLEKNEKVKVYAKLPQWFKVPTPLGSYNPDWAVVVEEAGTAKLYFVVETKSSIWDSDLRHSEGAKFKCGEKHFEEVVGGDSSAQYIKATNVKGMMNYVE